jgi:hypothetical protein
MRNTKSKITFVVLKVAPVDVYTIYQNLPYKNPRLAGENVFWNSKNCVTDLYKSRGEMAHIWKLGSKRVKGNLEATLLL